MLRILPAAVLFSKTASLVAATLLVLSPQVAKAQHDSGGDAPLSPQEASDIVIETLEDEEELDEAEVERAQASSAVPLPNGAEPGPAETPADTSARVVGLAMMVGGVALGFIVLALLRGRQER